jgi:hypothetical protein
MNWGAIAAVAELLGALAVIGSLIYLAVQIRQNTRSSRAATFQAAYSEVSHAYHAIAADSELARIFRIGLSEPQKLDQDEATRYGVVCQKPADENSRQFRILEAAMRAVPCPFRKPHP